MSELKVAEFREPDCNNTLTAICFLVDEKIWNKEKYLNFDVDMENMWTGNRMVETMEDYSKYVKSLGGQNITDLRNYLSKLKLAN